MNIAIMQPYFLPYIGYWQLINAVDIFVVYDNIQYTKKGWINRNRYLLNGKDALFTLPLKKESDFLTIKERAISDTFNKKKIFEQMAHSYVKAPYKKETLELLKDIIFFENSNLFEYIFNSINTICSYLDIHTKIVISSHITYDNTLKGQDKVLSICRALQSKTYTNAIGGQSLYNWEDFQKEHIDLKFLKTIFVQYPQFSQDFIPALSIIDVLMFTSVDEAKRMLSSYELVYDCL